jgi:hypothetical protein
MFKHLNLVNHLDIGNIWFRFLPLNVQNSQLRN